MSSTAWIIVGTILAICILIDVCMLIFCRKPKVIITWFAFRILFEIVLMILTSGKGGKGGSFGGGSSGGGGASSKW